MADDRVGMTGVQKFWTFVPLTLVCVFTLASYFGFIGKKPKAATPVTLYLFTGTNPAIRDCNVSPGILQVPPSTSDTKVSLQSVDGTTYTITLLSTRPLFSESGPYQTPGTYTIPANTMAGYYGFKISNNNNPPTDCSPLQDIGIIVGH
jgi:hypothetical protein